MARLRLDRYLPWVAGAACVVAILYVGAIDQRHTASKVPATLSLSGYHRTEQLDDDFERRAWIYAGITAVVLVGAAVAALARAKTVADRRRVFGETGVAGIVMALFGLVLRWQVHSPIEPSTASVLAPSAVLLMIAALGGTISRLQRPQPGEPSIPERRLGWGVAVAALACTATTVVCAIVWSAPQASSCSGNAPPAPGWTHPVGTLGWVTGLAAVILGLIGLTARRWFVALICLVVNPAAFFYALASSGAGC
jgi:hypothetical protein